ncbi:DUF4157 domain-containing protein [Yoonia sp. GPGPB17]|uniref:eCIS core domain-containing protein n=1 Tax=Yoonia sp. GPGPB17 TaxID=3026147 RepID=UPI0030BEE6AC
MNRFMYAVTVPLCVFINLSACGRPMTDGETLYAQSILTRDIALDTARFSGSDNLRFRRAIRQLREEGEIETLSRDLSEGSFEKDKSLLASALPELFGAPAMAVGNTVFFNRDRYVDDFSTTAYRDDLWLMAHELVHVWQWQNRDEVGYSFSKIVSEHLNYGDAVYYYQLETGKAFTDYRFEQQGAIVECYAQLLETQPNAATTKQHARLVEQVFPDQMLAELEMAAQSGQICARSDDRRKPCT